MGSKNQDLTNAVMSACDSAGARLHKLTASSETVQGVMIVARYSQWRVFVASIQYSGYYVDTTHWTAISGGEYIYDIMIYVAKPEYGCDNE